MKVDVSEAHQDETIEGLEASVKSRLVDEGSLEKPRSEIDIRSNEIDGDDDCDEDNDDTSTAVLIEAHNNSAAPNGSDPTELTRNIWKLCFGAAGIYAAYLYHGSLEEDLFRYRTADADVDADDGVSVSGFDYVWYLQVLESAACIVMGVVGRLVCGSTQTVSFGTITPFLTPGASQVFSKAFTNLALAAGLSFPIVILAKSAKIVPVMLGQLLLGDSTYGWRDYLFASLIVGGTALLSSGGEKTAGGRSNTLTGFILIVISLFMDGITAGLQKRLKVKSVANPPSAFDFLLFTNLSMIGIAVAISVALGEFKEGHKFLINNPEAATLVLQCCLCSAVGQSFIFYIIAQFDPLTCSTITTTRKLLSVLLSISFKGHPLNGRGMAGLGLAVAGLAVEIHNKVAHHGQHQQQMKDGSYRSIAGVSSFGDDDDDDDKSDSSLYKNMNGTIGLRDPQGRPLFQRLIR